jgi:hypothetical protein
MLAGDGRTGHCRDRKRCFASGPQKIGTVISLQGSSAIPPALRAGIAIRITAP